MSIEQIENRIKKVHNWFSSTRAIPLYLGLTVAAITTNVGFEMKSRLDELEAQSEKPETSRAFDQAQAPQAPAHTIPEAIHPEEKCLTDSCDPD